MYESPVLVRYGTFRDLTLQTQVCLTTPPYTGKSTRNADPFLGTLGEGCPAVRS
jgi:hypothetical protein